MEEKGEWGRVNELEYDIKLGSKYGPSAGGITEE